MHQFLKHLIIILQNKYYNKPIHKMALGGRKLTKSDVLIWSAVVVGVLDWISDMAYVSSATFASDALHSACVTFVVAQPVWYIFMFVVYVASHEEIDSAKERAEKMCLALPYALLHQFKLMGSFETCNSFIYHKFARRDQFLLFNLENSYRVQIVAELILEALPQIMIQASNNNWLGWSSGLSIASFVLSVLVLVKDVTVLTIFGIRKFIEKREDASLRPHCYPVVQPVTKLDKESMLAMKAYLLDPLKEAADADGNTATHTLAQRDDDLGGLKQSATKCPHHLFMLNKHGQTPLDICIEEDWLSNLEATQEQDSPISPRNEGTDFEKSGAKVTPSGPPYPVHGANSTTKVIDESQTRLQRKNKDPEKAERRAAAQATQSKRMKKTLMLMKMMEGYHHNCSIKFLK